jgi:TP901 family phage tail tape measure protein
MTQNVIVSLKFNADTADTQKVAAGMAKMAQDTKDAARQMAKDLADVSTGLAALDMKMMSIKPVDLKLTLGSKQLKDQLTNVAQYADEARFALGNLDAQAAKPILDKAQWQWKSYAQTLNETKAAEKDLAATLAATDKQMEAQVKGALDRLVMDRKNADEQQKAAEKDLLAAAKLSTKEQEALAKELAQTDTAMKKQQERAVQSLANEEKQALETIERMHQKAADAISRAQQQQQKDLDKTGQAVQNLENKVGLMPAKDLKLIQNTPELNAQLQEVTQHLNDSKKALDSLDGNKAKEELDKAKQGFDQLKRSTADTKAALGDVKKQLDFGTQVAKAVKDFARMGQTFMTSVRQIGQGIMSIGVMMTGAITYPLQQVGKNLLDATMEYGQTEAALRAVTTAQEGGAAAVDSTSKKILDAAGNYTFGANKMLTTTLFIKEAGLDLNTSFLATVAGANLATAAYDGAERTAENYKTATMDLMQATRMFNPEVVNAAVKTGDYAAVQKLLTKNSDILANVLNTSAARMDDFIQGFDYLAPVATTVNASLKDTAIFIGMLADAGITGSRGGRELASGILKLSTPTAQTKADMDKLGIVIYDNNGKFVGFEKLITELNQVFVQGIPLIQQNTKELKTMGTAAIEASEQVTRANAKFRDDQLKTQGAINKALTAKPAKGAPGLSADTIGAYKQAIAAIQGSPAQVEQQTLALMKNQGVWNSLTDSMRSQIITISKDNDAILKTQSAYDKQVAGTKDLITSNKTLTDAEKTRLEVEMFGQAGFRGFIPTIKQGDDAYTKYNKAVEKGSSAEKIANDKTHNLLDSWTKLNVLWESKMIPTIRELADKYIAPLIDRLTELVNWFTDLDEPTKEFIIKMAAIAAAIGPLLFVIGGLLFSLGMIGTGFFSMVGLLANPLGILIATGAFAGLAGAMASIVPMIQAIVSGDWKKLDGYINGFAKNIQDIPNKIKIGADAIGGFWNSFTDALSKGLDQGKLGKLRDSIKSMFSNVFGGALEPVTVERTVPITFEGKPVTGIKDFPQTIQIFEQIPKIQADAEKFGKAIGDGLANATNFITGFLSTVSAEIAKHTPDIGSALGRIGDAIGKIVTNIGKMDSKKFFEFLDGFSDNVLKGAVIVLNDIASALERIAAVVTLFNSPQAQNSPIAKGALLFAGLTYPTKGDIENEQKAGAGFAALGYKPYEIGGADDPYAGPIGSLRLIKDLLTQDYEKQKALFSTPVPAWPVAPGLITPIELGGGASAVGMGQGAGNFGKNFYLTVAPNLTTITNRDDMFFLAQEIVRVIKENDC